MLDRLGVTAGGVQHCVWPLLLIGYAPQLSRQGLLSTCLTRIPGLFRAELKLSLGVFIVILTCGCAVHNCALCLLMFVVLKHEDENTMDKMEGWMV